MTPMRDGGVMADRLTAEGGVCDRRARSKLEPAVDEATADMGVPVKEALLGVRCRRVRLRGRMRMVGVTWREEEGGERLVGLAANAAAGGLAGGVCSWSLVALVMVVVLPLAVAAASALVAAAAAAATAAEARVTGRLERGWNACVCLGDL